MQMQNWKSTLSQVQRVSPNNTNTNTYTKTTLPQIQTASIHKHKCKYNLSADADGVPHLVLGVQLPLVAHRDLLLTETLKKI